MSMPRDESIRALGKAGAEYARGTGLYMQLDFEPGKLRNASKKEGVAFARLLCASLDLDDCFIEAVESAQLEQSARRPANGALATDKLMGPGLSLRDTVAALEDWRHGDWGWPWSGR